jgi:hypothetical protein
MTEQTHPIPAVMDLALCSHSFPRLPELLIPRDNLLNTIERMLGGAIELVMIEGDESLGKTTLLAQFARWHLDHTFSVFIKAASKFGYDPATGRYDLCCQLLWALRPDESCKPEEADDGYLRKLLLELRKRARREAFYFVLDGMADIPDESIRSVILDMLPLMVSFSLDETIKYFADCALEPDLVEGLYQACGRGIPGHLASARRNILTGQDPRTLLKDKLTDLFEKEWNQVLNDELALKALAIITHALHRPSVEELTRLIGQDKERVEATLAGITFLTIDDRTSEVSFESDAFRKFATTKLRDRRQQVIDLIIDDLTARPESEVTVSHLPVYFEQRGKLKEVLVSMQKSVIAELEGAEVWRSEIEALMALNDYAGAMNLAQSMLLKEDRLHLLAVIAKSRREHDQPAETELLQQIRTLYD